MFQFLNNSFSLLRFFLFSFIRCVFPRLLIYKTDTFVIALIFEWLLKNWAVLLNGSLLEKWWKKTMVCACFSMPIMHFLCYISHNWFSLNNNHSKLAWLSMYPNSWDFSFTYIYLLFTVDILKLNVFHLHSLGIYLHRKSIDKLHVILSHV